MMSFIFVALVLRDVLSTTVCVGNTQTSRLCVFDGGGGVEGVPLPILGIAVRLDEKAQV